jgi:adenylate kinase
MTGRHLSTDETDHHDRLTVLMLGAPGSGKGTQGERLAVRHGVPHLSSGDLLRAHVQRGTDLGRAVQDAMRRGDLIADDLVISMVLDEVLGPRAARGFVLDGFPRTVPQAKAAYEAARQHGVTLRAVVFLEVPYELLLARLTARGAESGRADDTEATIRHRIEVYTEQTLPLVDYYAGRGIIHRVDATGTIDDVTARVFAAIDDT